MTRFTLLLGATLLIAACEASGAEQAVSQSASLPASLPLRRDSGTVAEAASWAPSLALLMLAGAGGAWAWWRRSPRARGRAGAFGREEIVRLSSQPLTPDASVHAVQWGGEELLLACTAHQVTLLARRPIVRAGTES